MTSYGTHRAHEVRLITALLTAICAAGAAGSVLPGVEHAITTGLLALTGLVALATAARFTARALRERREDRADARAAARWQAIHAPHLLHTATRQHVRADRGVA